MQKRKSRWYIKSLLSYLLMAGILLCCIGIPIVRNIRVMVETEVMENTSSALDAVCTRFDDWLLSMETYVIQIKNDAQMNPYTLMGNAYEALKASESLQRTAVYDDIYETIAIVYARDYFASLPHVYSSQGNFDSRTFFSYSYRYDRWDETAVYEDLRSIVKPVLRSPEWATTGRMNRKQYLTYIVPLGNGSVNNNRGGVLFIVPVDNFLKMISDVNIPQDATLVMTDRDGHVVLWDGALGLNENFKLPDQSQGKYTVLDEQCQILQSKDKSGEWRFALLMPESAITEAIQPRLWQIMLILSLGMVIAVAASLALSQWVFRPVRRLSGIAHSLKNEKMEHADEFEQIEQVMTGLSKTNIDLLSKLNSQNSSMRQHILQAMCMNRMDQKDNFLALLQEDGIYFDESALRMLVLRIDNEEQLELRMDNSMRALTRFGLLKILRETAKTCGVSSIGCESGIDNYIIALLSGRVEDEAQLRIMLMQMQEIVMENFGFSLTIGVSDRFSGLDQISAECQKALRLSESRYIEGHGLVFTPSETRMTECIDDNMRRKLMTLKSYVISALREEKYAKAIDTINQYVQSIREYHLPPAAARQQMIVLRSAICQQMLIQGLETDSMNRLSNRQYETMDYLRDAMITALENLAEQTNVQENQHSELIERCINYMNTNLSDSTLTLEGVAEGLGVSSGYLSRSFKAQMGVSPWQYFDNMRLQRACNLLKDTPLRIGDILLACGYVDKANFMRKFKRQYGMTPMDYRKASSLSSVVESEQEVNEIEDSLPE